MSYILDALKKSQSERELGQVPTLHSAPVPRAPSARPPQPWAVVALVSVVVALALLGLYLTRTTMPSAAVARTAVAPPPEPVAEVPADVAPMAAPSDAHAASAPSRNTPPPHPSPGPESAVVAQPAVSQASVTPPADPDGGFTATEAQREVPRLGELSDVQRSALPALELNVHVYATAPQARFVYLNNHKYREGETTREGLTVEAITPIGVILRLAKLRFQLQV